MSKKKLKIKSNKAYPLNQCNLYKINSHKKLCAILGISKEELKLISDVSKNSSFYNCYRNKNERTIQEPINLMCRVHNRIANLISRIKTPEYIHYSKKGCSHLTNAEAHIQAQQLLTFD